MNRHGGRRQGSGRKSLASRPATITVRLSRYRAQQFKDCCAFYRCTHAEMLESWLDQDNVRGDFPP